MNNITKKNAALAYYAWLIRAIARPQTFEEWLDWLFIYFSTGSEWVPPPSVSLSRRAAHQPGFIHLNSLTQWAWGLLPYWFWRITRDKPLLREAFMALQRQHDAAECKTLNMIHSKPGSLAPEGTPHCFPMDLRSQKLNIKCCKGGGNCVSYSIWIWS